jgi:hypothetical protein
MNMKDHVLLEASSESSEEEPVPTEPAPESEESGPEPARDSPIFRRNGLPCRALVDRQGDLWVISSESQQLDRIAHALALRLENVQELGFDVADMLPLATQKAIQRALYEEWFRGPIG